VIFFPLGGIMKENVCFEFASTAVIFCCGDGIIGTFIFFACFFPVL
jgi:hypothetical protein